MKVSELIEKLQRTDGDAPVRVRVFVGPPEESYTSRDVAVWESAPGGVVVIEGGR